MNGKEVAAKGDEGIEVALGVGAAPGFRFFAGISGAVLFLCGCLEWVLLSRSWALGARRERNGPVPLPLPWVPAFAGTTVG